MSFMSYDSPPPSSPASSPSPYVDSSPPSSPGSSFIDTSFHESPGPQDPYAASAKAVRQPRLYEKKRARSISPTPEVPARTTKAPRASSPAPAPEIDTNVVWDEEDIWNDAVTRVVDIAHGKIDLEARGLTRIPPCVADLAYFWAPKEDQATASNSQLEFYDKGPARKSQSFSRTKSLAEFSGFARDKIALLLALNQIKVLPPELFCLKNLTVLSLRGNNLTHLPPEVNQLTALTNLNIASNRITFLPSEIMDLTLSQLQIYPNPFLPPPSNTRSARTFSRSRSRYKSSETPPKPCSPTIPVFEHVIPLFELCLRALVTDSPAHPQHSVLEDVYELPLSEYPAPTLPKGKRRFTQQLPPLIHDVLDAVLPGSVYEDPDDSPNSSQASRLSMSLSQTTFPDFEAWLKLRKDALASPSTEYHCVTGKGVCPSPKHEGEAPAVFVVHAEERFTWEHTVAGVPNLGDVPIRWRGCQRGCLDYLDGKQKGTPEVQPTQDFSAPPKQNDDVGAVDLVQPVGFTAGSFTLDDFNDG